MNNIVLTLFACLSYCSGFLNINDVTAPETLTKLPKDFSLAVTNIAEGIPAKSLTIVRGNSTNIRYSSEKRNTLCHY